jgi:hypothetical protein
MAKGVDGSRMWIIFAAIRDSPEGVMIISTNCRNPQPVIFKRFNARQIASGMCRKYTHNPVSRPPLGIIGRVVCFPLINKWLPDVLRAGAGSGTADAVIAGE